MQEHSDTPTHQEYTTYTHDRDTPTHQRTHLLTRDTPTHREPPTFMHRNIPTHRNTEIHHLHNKGALYHMDAPLHTKDQGHTHRQEPPYMPSTQGHTPTFQRRTTYTPKGTSTHRDTPIHHGHTYTTHYMLYILHLTNVCVCELNCVCIVCRWLHVCVN